MHREANLSASGGWENLVTVLDSWNSTRWQGRIRNTAGSRCAQSQVLYISDMHCRTQSCQKWIFRLAQAGGCYGPISHSHYTTLRLSRLPGSNYQRHAQVSQHQQGTPPGNAPASVCKVHIALVLPFLHAGAGVTIFKVRVAVGVEQ